MSVNTIILEVDYDILEMSVRTFQWNVLTDKTTNFLS
jgi:hypothetical protein